MKQLLLKLKNKKKIIFWGNTPYKWLLDQVDSKDLYLETAFYDTNSKTAF